MRGMEVRASHWRAVLVLAGWPQVPI